MLAKSKRPSGPQLFLRCRSAALRMSAELATVPPIDDGCVWGEFAGIELQYDEVFWSVQSHKPVQEAIDGVVRIIDLAALGQEREDMEIVHVIGDAKNGHFRRQHRRSNNKTIRHANSNRHSPRNAAQAASRGRPRQSRRSCRLCVRARKAKAQAWAFSMRTTLAGRPDRHRSLDAMPQSADATGDASPVRGRISIDVR
jgi:hypothetical protein